MSPKLTSIYTDRMDFERINTDNLVKGVLLISLIFLFVGHNLFDRKVLFATLLIYLLFCIKFIPIIIKQVMSNYQLAIVLIWCFVSVLWSSWGHKSLEEAIIQTMMFLSGVLIAFTFSISTLLKTLTITAYVVVSINFLSLLVLGGNAFGEAGMVGFYNHKNNFGLVMSLSLLICCYDFLVNRRKLSIMFSVMSLLLLLLSMSKTSIALFFICSMASIVAYRLGGGSKFALVVPIKITSFLLLLFAFLMAVLYRFEVLDYLYYSMDEELLTGRGKLWLTMLLHAENNTIYGFGFNAVWGKGELSEIYYTDLFTDNPLWVESLAASDGGYIDLIVSIGLVGLFLFTFYIVNTGINIFCLIRERGFALLFSIFLFITLHNITETTFLFSTNLLWYLFILVSCISANKLYREHNLNV